MTEWLNWTEWFLLPSVTSQGLQRRANILERLDPALLNPPDSHLPSCLLAEHQMANQSSVLPTCWKIKVLSVTGVVWWLSGFQFFCDSTDCSLPSTSVLEISQARIMECCHFLHQGICPTEGLNPCLFVGRQVLYLWAAWEAPTLATTSLFSISESLFLFHWSEVKVVQSCPTLCDPMDYTVHGIFQARIPEWVALLFSRGSS